MVNLFGIMYKSVVRIQVNDTEPTQRISVFRPCWCSYSEYEPASSQEQRLRSVPPRLQLRRKSCAAVEVQILCLGLHQKSCPWEARARARAPPWPIELVECYRGSAPQRRLQIRPPRHLLDGRHWSLGTAAFLCFQYVEFRCPRNRYHQQCRAHELLQRAADETKRRNDERLPPRHAAAGALVSALAVCTWGTYR